MLVDGINVNRLNGGHSNNMSNFSITFKDSSELISFANKFIVDDRLNSLENDVYRSVPSAHKSEGTDYTLFPALLYCFSIIDLLGGIICRKRI
jgi:hypothetical protein